MVAGSGRDNSAPPFFTYGSGVNVTHVVLRLRQIVALFLASLSYLNDLQKKPFCTAKTEIGVLLLAL